ncbi:ArdC-like ssDNA-binding domain-containing protein [Paeniglutamicibacter sp. NPDC091659]|uniref:ArdC-like ssDNA-binding domain-containing protein n=1 Tax=Paeniglutamicibacter sp. NPDC091659 TaxID=3364389 RepID=UPI00380C5157
MTERLTKPRARAEQEPVNIEWQKLLEEALTLEPGEMTSYNRFYNYSMLNQLLLHSQGVREPVATYAKWQELGRQVQKGSKAKAILRPIFYKGTNDQGEEEQKVKGFKMVNCLFTVSETEGEELPEYEPPTWNKERALGALAIVQVDFEQINGNVAGYSYERNVAVSPVAKYPFKTLLHEIGHVTLGHTSEQGLEDYREHRGIKEFQAESTAYLTMNELQATDQFDAAESRGYIQGWLRNGRPDDAAIRQVFTATDKILKAGRLSASDSQ